MDRRLSVLIPCKNEEHNLPECLKSVESIADEIVVADSGSTDGTIDYAHAHGCRVIKREYRHAGDFNNWAIPQCQHKWVLLVDADERVTHELAEEIKAVLDEPADKIGYWIYRRTYFLGKPLRYSGCSSDKVLRLFRRDQARYVGDTDHAEIDLPESKVAHLQSRLQHFSYWGLDDYFRKFHRYTSQKAEVRFAAGRKPSFAKMLLTVPFRFFHLYLTRWGFLDGVPGLLFCMYSAMSSFTAQAMLWEKHLKSTNPESIRGLAASSLQVEKSKVRKAA